MSRHQLSAAATADLPDSDPDYASVTAPVLVLTAEHAPIGVREMTAAVADAFRNAPTDRVVVPDSGYAVNLDNPAFA
jgi:pimeloyl-ACP methyl ester carboxylesterase